MLDRRDIRRTQPLSTIQKCVTIAWIILPCTSSTLAVHLRTGEGRNERQVLYTGRRLTNTHILVSKAHHKNDKGEATAEIKHTRKDTHVCVAVPSLMASAFTIEEVDVAQKTMAMHMKSRLERIVSVQSDNTSQNRHETRRKRCTSLILP